MAIAKIHILCHINFNNIKKTKQLQKQTYKVLRTAAGIWLVVIQIKIATHKYHWSTVLLSQKLLSVKQHNRSAKNETHSPLASSFADDTFFLNSH